MRMIQIFFAAVFLFFSGQIFAAGVTINAGDTAYRNLPDVAGTGIRSEVEIRISALTHIVGAYRVTHGTGSLSVGTIVTIKWQDGSSEKAKIIATIGSVLAEPIPGTQSNPSGGGIGYTHGPGGNYYGGSNVTGFRVITQTVTVCVAGYCESALVVTGYEWIYGPGGGPGNEMV